MKITHTIDYQHLKMLIKKSLQRQGITLKRLCSDLEISVSGYTKMFREESMKIEVLLTLCNYCTIDVAEVIGIKSNEKILKMEIASLNAQVQALREFIENEINFPGTQINTDE